MFSKLVSFFYKGENYQCPICQQKFRKFLPYGNKGIDNRLCPSCLSLERHRLIWLFLEKKTDFFTKKARFLHIAPEQPFLNRFKQLSNLEYITADLESPIADVKLDIQNMPFGENEFDIVMANHVLEHIPDENKAFSEIYRILKNGGWCILQVPLDPNKSETYEDKSITSPKMREIHFGQYDHLRLYGLDYPEKIKKAGFSVETIDLISELSIELAHYYRLDFSEKIYWAKKI